MSDNENQAGGGEERDEKKPQVSNSEHVNLKVSYLLSSPMVLIKAGCWTCA